MFNTSNYNNILNINSVSGTIIKSYPKTFFVRFNLKSQLAEELLNHSPHMYTNSYSNDREEIVVLQMMMCGDMEVIAEIMFKKDFEELVIKGCDK